MSVMKTKMRLSAAVMMIAVLAFAVLSGCSLLTDDDPYRANIRAGMKTPETSKLFVKYVDPESKVTSYMLKPGIVSENQQSMYFNVKSMTDDGRFMVVHCSANEYTGDGKGTKKTKVQRTKCFNGLAVINFMKDEIIKLDGGRMNGFCTRLDTTYDRLYYVRKTKNQADDAICRRDLLGDPGKEIEVCKIPYELHHGSNVMYYCTHLTLNGARNKAFLESKLGSGTWDGKRQPDDIYVQGVVDLETGKYESWGSTDFFCNHGQFNPKRDDLALCAWEHLYMEDGQAYIKKTGLFPRLWLLRADGSKEMIPARRTNYATHEIWDEDGTGFAWCGGGVYHHDLATSRQELYCPCHAQHATLSADRSLVVYDEHIGGWWRGAPWRVGFWNRETERNVFIYSTRPALGGSTGKDNESRLHPDAHPQFVCNDRYIVSTFNNLDGHMDFLVTPVKPLTEMTRREKEPGDLLAVWPIGKGPQIISTRITDQFLAGRPEDYHPVGYHGNSGYGWKKSVQYSLVSLWVNALACTRKTGDGIRRQKLIRLYEDFRPWGKLKDCRSKPYHVDYTIFGALPYEIYLANGNKKCLEEGNFYADTQWTPPCEGTLTWRNAASSEIQWDFWKRGYTPQTRLWIDDMYMITAIQSQAYRATGDRKYIDRTAREMCLYLDKLQLREGRAKGLFYHAPDVPYVWGRGDGWMAAGMALVLTYLPEDSEFRPKIMAGYRQMMESLAKFQREDGLWNQLVDEVDAPDNWGETSCTAMFAYAFAAGVCKGWLDAAEYAPRVRKAYLALVDRMDEYGNISDVCAGTPKKNDRQFYIDRPRVNGDPHAQAPMLWLCSVLLEGER